jgi:hypothetical protein
VLRDAYFFHSFLGRCEGEKSWVSVNRGLSKEYIEREQIFFGFDFDEKLLP